MLRTRALLALATALLLLAACGRSGFADVPVQDEPAPATPEQQRCYGVPPGTLVLIELLPTSFKHEVGPSGRFRYRPYELRARCSGWVRVQEAWEYWTLRRPFRLQGDTVGRRADCRETMERGLSLEPDRGDIVTLSVIDADNPDWGILVVALEE